MNKLFYLLFLIILLSSGCQTDSPERVNLPQDKKIQVYFNHRDTGNKKYTDDYRNVTRTGDNLEAVILSAIEHSKSSIDVAVQELQLPGIALALARQAQKGIQVRVILDNKYSRAISSYSSSEITKLPTRERARFRQYFKLIDVDNNGALNSQEINNRDALIILENANISIIDDTADGSKGSGLMHHKFIVIDRKTVITGSTNFTLSGIHGDLSNLNTKGNVNHLLVIENQKLAQVFTEEFNYMWGDDSSNRTHKFGLQKPWRSPKSITWKDTQIVIQFAPTSGKQEWHFSTNGLITKTIEQATKSIDLALFVFSEQKIVDTLQQKQQQGIKIQGVFDSGFAYRYYSEVLDMLGMTRYQNCQPEINNNPWQTPLKTVGIANLAMGDKLHHKFALIDRQTVISGSPNWSQAANQQNDEALIIISNPAVAQHFSQEFQRLYNSALRELSPKIKNQINQSLQCN